MIACLLRDQRGSQAVMLVFVMGCVGGALATAMWLAIITGHSALAALSAIVIGSLTVILLMQVTQSNPNLADIASIAQEEGEMSVPAKSNSKGISL
jgi:hypothetical protein